MSEPAVVLRSARGRWVLFATILGSGMAMIDATIVNVALPRIGEDLHAGLTALQWTVNAYTLTLAGLLLLGGSLGDRLGRRRVFVIGTVWFAVASTACALAPDAGFLITARAVQGVGAALLTPGSLAILEAVFRTEDRAEAVGAWSGLGGVASALGPVLGGLLVGAAPWGWRLAFLINVPIATVVSLVAARHVPETRDDAASGRLDVVGAASAALGLALVVYGLTEGAGSRWTCVAVGAVVAGAVVLVGFVRHESRAVTPMMPPTLFRSRQFTGANVVTFVLYAALGGAIFLLPLQLQRGSGFAPIAAGSALLPVTVVMALLSARMGRLAQRIGPRRPMTFGPLVAAVGMLLLSRIGTTTGYLTGVLPGALVLSLGLSATVAPLTATALASAPARDVGVASAVNNDVARTGGLLSVGVLPGLAGIDQAAYGNAARLSTGFGHAMLIVAVLCALGGLLSWLTIDDGVLDRPSR